MYENILKSIVISGGLILKKFQGRVERKSKQSDLDEKYVQKSSVAHTELDDLVQEIALEILHSHFSDINLNVEEETPRISKVLNSNAEITFHLDPLDGTYAYTENRNDYAIGAAISRGTEFVASSVYLPAKDRVYYADNSATFKLTDGMGKMIEFQRSPIISKYVQKRCEDYVNVIDEMKLKKLDSMSAHNTMMELVEGNASISLYHKAAPHDFGIPKLILEAVGGVCTDENGNQIEFKPEFPRVEYFFAFANQKIKNEFFQRKSL